MEPAPEKKEGEKKQSVLPTASAVLDSGELVEMVYDPAGRQTQFVVGSVDSKEDEAHRELRRPVRKREAEVRSESGRTLIRAVR
jgi:hypothetical protein